MELDLGLAETNEPFGIALRDGLEHLEYDLSAVHRLYLLCSLSEVR